MICDLCNADGDAQNEDGTLQLGGGLMGSYALCPECVAKVDAEEVKLLDPQKTFGDNIRALRLAETGSEDLIIEMYTWDKGDLE